MFANNNLFIKEYRNKNILLVIFNFDLILH